MGYLKKLKVAMWFVTAVGELRVADFHPALPLHFMCDSAVSNFILLGLGFLILRKVGIIPCKPGIGLVTLNDQDFGVLTFNVYL